MRGSEQRDIGFAMGGGIFGTCQRRVQQGRVAEIGRTAMLRQLLMARGDDRPARCRPPPPPRNRPGATCTHTLVARTEKDIRGFIQRSVAPDGQAGIELFGAATNPGLGDPHRWSRKFHQDVRHLRVEAPCTYIPAKAILSACGARALLRGAGIQATATHLRQSKINWPTRVTMIFGLKP